MRSAATRSRPVRFETAALVHSDDIWNVRYEGDRSPEPVPADRRRERRPQRVLVVDDNDSIRELWHTYLALSGFAVTEAVNGVDAVERAVQAPPVAIIMDFRCTSR